MGGGLGWGPSPSCEAWPGGWRSWPPCPLEPSPPITLVPAFGPCAWLALGVFISLMEVCHWLQEETLPAHENAAKCGLTGAGMFRAGPAVLPPPGCRGTLSFLPSLHPPREDGTRGSGQGAASIY